MGRSRIGASFLSLALASAALIGIGGCRKLGFGDKEELLESQERTDKRYLTDRLAAVCDGRAFPEVPRYEPKKGSHPTAIVRRFTGGGSSGDAYAVEAPFWPKKLEETELVACVESPTQSFGSETAKAEIRRAQDGAVLASLSIPAVSGGDRERDEAVIQAVTAYAEGTAVIQAPASASASVSAAPSGSAAGRLKKPAPPAPKR
ncbi:MAG: hypothetical protein U0271_13375 [Polyangiaceae bacterium]